MDVRKHRKSQKLDTYDLKILYHLSQDLNTPRKQLASKLKISRETLNYRIKKLQNTLIEPYAVISFEQLGLKSHLISVEDLSKAQLDRIKRHPDTFCVMEVMSNKRYRIITLCLKLEKFIAECLPDSQFQTREITRHEVDHFNGFLENNVRIKETIKEDGNITLDRYDYKLLIAAIQEPGSSYSEIARQTGLDRLTVKNHLRRLETNNYIQKYRYAIDVFRMGFTGYFFTVRCKQSEQNAVRETIDLNNHSGFRYRHLNGYSFNYISPTYHEVAEMIDTLRDIAPGARIEVLQIAGTYTLNTKPRSLLKHLIRLAK